MSNVLSTKCTFAVAAAAICTIGAMAPATEPGSDPPESITLTGVVRDFRHRNVQGGHPDFQKRPDRGFGLYCGNISPLLGPNKKPVFTGGGSKVYQQWRNSAGDPICYNLYDPALGDAQGYNGPASTGGIQSSESFDSWYQDVLGTNLSQTLELTLHRQEDGSYVFDSDTDSPYKELGGFFPIEHQLYGNSGLSPDRNFHFTFELQTEFTYDEDGAQIFKFTGDDDVWVFIDGRLVIDLGGVHGKIEQVVDLNRLGLLDGETYELAFFFAERHTTQSNFRITTNLQLATVEVPTVSAAFD